MGRSITLTELAALADEREDTNSVLGTHPARILEPFMVPTKRDPGAVGWVDQEEDADDRRRKYLVLTTKGAKIASALASLVSGRPDADSK